jgi:MoxR-like ATPase
MTIRSEAGPQLDVDTTALAVRLQGLARALDEVFLDKQEIIRLMIVSALAGEHLVLIGPPGTAKSALIRAFAQLLDARYFEYLLTRFTEPNELFGPVDMQAFREGEYRRRTERMLPEAEVVFLDEVFKANSAILNSLLSVLNERRYTSGRHAIECPLLSVFAASNDVPKEEELQAVLDRFIVRVRSDNLDSYHFHNLVAKGIEHEVGRLSSRGAKPEPLLSSKTLHQVHHAYGSLMRFPERFAATYKGLIFQIRSEGISVSDRRVVKLMKLFAASALFDGRTEACDADFFLLKHIWNTPDQADILAEIVAPVVDRYYQEHPDERRFVGPSANLQDLLGELTIIRDLLTRGERLSDIQLFSQLKNLNEIKGALQALDNDAARKMVTQVDQLLDSVFSASRFV